MALLPKEHGAYGQLTLPILTALSVSGISTAGLFLAASAVAGFLAHEPVALLVGSRGPRATRELRQVAIRWLAVCAGVTVVALMIALLAMDRAARWSIAVPVLPALLLGMATVRGREKSWYGEVAAAAAFAGLGVPLSVAGGAPLRVAAATAVPFVLLFVTSTLAVRTVILRVRGGGDPRATAATRTSTFAVTAAGATCIGWLTAIDALPVAALIAAAPGSVTALVIAARPPRPTHLRRIGWILVGTSVLTAAIAVATL